MLGAPSRYRGRSSSCVAIALVVIYAFVSIDLYYDRYLPRYLFHFSDAERDQSCLPITHGKFDGPACCAYRQEGVKETTQLEGPPRKDFGGRVLYYTMGSKSYVEGVEKGFVGRLMDLGVEERDIGVVCIDEFCHQYFTEIDIDLRVELYSDDEISETNCSAQRQGKRAMTCKIAMGKANVITDRLNEGHAVFFFDADVEFFRHPYKAMKVSNANLDFYVQEDHNGSMNYGAMLVYPSPLTLDLFRYIKEEFDRTLEWDQNLLNMFLRPKHTKWGDAIKNTFPDENPGDRGVCGDALDYEYLPLQSYMNMLKEGTFDISKFDEDNHVMVHATCIEGSKNKEMVLRIMFGMYAQGSKDYYLNTKTVALDSHMGDYRDRLEYVDQAMQALVYIAKETGRAIRLTGDTLSFFTDARNPFSVVSAEYIWGELGLPVVEPLFYSRAEDRYGRDEPMILHVVVKDEADLSRAHFLDQTDGWQHSESDELVFHIDELVALDGDVIGELAGEDLGYSNGAWKRPFTCLRAKAMCMSVCDAW